MKTGDKITICAIHRDNRCEDPDPIYIGYLSEIRQEGVYYMTMVDGEIEFIPMILVKKVVNYWF